MAVADAVRHMECLEFDNRIVAIYTGREHCDWGICPDDNTDSYKEVGALLGIEASDMLRIPQTHTSDVRKIESIHRGEGVVKEVSVAGFDGMVTDEPGILLCTVEADCVPVYIYDPVKSAVAMVHSGWKGTAGEISLKAVNMMISEYGSKAEDIKVAFGPAICGDCYEFGGELKEEFLTHFTVEETDSFFTPRKDGKYSLDLLKAISISLMKAGVRQENIMSSGICTYEDNNLCSWRRDKEHGKRMLTAIMIKKEGQI